MANALKPGKGALMLSSHDALGDPYVSLDLPLEAMLFDSVKVFEPNSKGVSGTMKGRGALMSWISGAASSCSMKVARIDTATPSISPLLQSACIGL